MTAVQPPTGSPVDVDVVVASADRTRVLTRSGTRELPRLQLATWPPPSSQLPTVVAQTTGVLVALLEPLDATVFVAEAVGGEPVAGWTWTDRAALDSGPVRQWQQRSTPATCPPWYRTGWYARAVDWVDAVLAERATPRTGPVRQVRHWTTSCVLHVPTSAGPVFCKAVLPHLAHEPAVIGHLARSWPTAVPEVLAHSAQDGWWLTADFGAQPPVRDGAAALRLLARIQVDSADDTAVLRDLGCPVLTLDDLADRVPALMRRTELWRQATAGNPGRAVPDQAGLTRIGMWLQDRCAELDDADLPLSLVHGDIHQHNAATRADGPLLFDWSFAAVSHPLLDLASWLHAVGEADARRQVTAYLDGWRQFGSPGGLRTVWRTARPVAALKELVKFVDLADRMGPDYEFDYLPMAYLWARRVRDAFDGRDGHLTGWSDPQPGPSGG